MSNYTFEMVPELVGRIAELLASIDEKIDKITFPSSPSGDHPEIMGINELCNYLPSHPSSKTVYSWCHNNTIPYYKQGKRSFFKKSEIDKWLLRTRVKDWTEMIEEAENRQEMSRLKKRGQ